MPSTCAPALGLAIHTSSPDLGLAIGQFSEIPRSQIWDLGRDLSTLLHVKLTEFMADTPWESLAFIAVAQGPGSFTGTRMGVVTARTLAQQLKIPLFGISSLAAIADRYSPESKAAISPETSPETVAIQLPAQRDEFHVGVYYPGDRLPIDPSGHQLPSDQVMKLDQWTDYRSQFSPFPELIEAPIHQGSWANEILKIAHIAFQAGDRPTWTHTLPTYGQHPIQ